MKTQKNFVYIGLSIITWIIFVGLCIEAGGLIVNFLFSIFKPEMVGNLYQKMDLSELYRQNQWAFYGIYSFAMFVAVLKALLFYYAISLLHQLDLSKPFNTFVSNKISQIGGTTLSIGIISYIAREVSNSMAYKDYHLEQLNPFWIDSQAFILMAAVIYIIALIFKKGVELQTENDLTV